VLGDLSIINKPFCIVECLGVCLFSNGNIWGGGYYHRSLIIRNRRASTVLISNCAAGKQLSQVIRNTSFYCGVLGPWMIF
jgi:hypothetical protein